MIEIKKSDSEETEKENHWSAERTIYAIIFYK